MSQLLSDISGIPIEPWEAVSGKDIREGVLEIPEQCDPPIPD